MQDSNQQSEEPLAHIVLLPYGRRGDVRQGLSILEAARQLGVELESICGGRQTCGKCLIEPEYGPFPKHQIMSNPEHLSAPTDREKNYALRHSIDLQTTRMACAACVRGNILVHVPESSHAQKQIIRKAASHIKIDVAPSVRLYYVELEKAQLGGTSDWQRLSKALETQWSITHPIIDAVLLPQMQHAIHVGQDRVTITLWNGREIIRVSPGYDESEYGLAIDIGSTTLAAYLCDLRSGKLLATETMMNPQVRYGEDLMSRITYGMQEQEGTQRLHDTLIDALNTLAQKTAETAAIRTDAITDVVLVGNSVMHHSLLAIELSGLGVAPFSLTTSHALDLAARDLNLHMVALGAKAHILPCIAGHVGADNAAVLLAEYLQFSDDVVCIVDIGTNAEILLGTRNHILSASSPTGPAFEGAEITHGQRAAPGAIERVRIDPTSGMVRHKVIGNDRWNDDPQADKHSQKATGICGSGIIEVVAEMFAAGLIDASGAFTAESPEKSPHIRQQNQQYGLIVAPAEHTTTGKPIIVTQRDIRAVQLAKAALYAGVRILMDRLGISQINRIKLAGAFGSYIDPRYALRLGLIPDCHPDHITSIGNAAGDGARIALLNMGQRALIQELVCKVEYVETATEPSFQRHFVSAMVLPHATDPFPHLERLIGQLSSGSKRHRRSPRKTHLKQN